VKRLPLILLGIAAVAGLGLLSSIVTHGFQEVDRAEQERARLEAEKARLEASIDRLETTLEALRSNPEAVESMARRDLGWIRPGERVILIATPTPRQAPPSLTGPTPTPILTLRK
jgi:cell division protein FtsB